MLRQGCYVADSPIGSLFAATCSIPDRHSSCHCCHACEVIDVPSKCKLRGARTYSTCTGTPAEDTLQDECQHLQQAFQAWAQTSAVAGHHLASAGAASMPEAEAAQQLDPEALLGCFCWAHAVMERCCLPGKQGPCIVPHISSIPPVRSFDYCACPCLAGSEASDSDDAAA